MLLADWIAVAVLAVALLLGLIAGFAGGLKFFTGGIFGIIISIIVCYFLYGVVSDWAFVNDLLGKLSGSVASGGNAFTDFLVNIHFEAVLLCIIMFVVVQILRIIIVKIIAGVLEINNTALKVINKLLGMVLMVAVAFMVGLIAFQIIYWVGGESAQQVSDAFNGSVLKLDWLYENNPLRSMVHYFSLA